MPAWFWISVAELPGRVRRFHLSELAPVYKPGQV